MPKMSKNVFFFVFTPILLTFDFRPILTGSPLIFWSLVVLGCFPSFCLYLILDRLFVDVDSR